MKSDAELVGQVVRGDSDAFRKLVERYESLVRSVALSVVQDQHAAEDVAQEAFVTAYRTLQSLRDPTKFSGWLLKIAGRRAARWVKSRHRIPASIGGIEVTDLRNGQLTDQSQTLLELIGRLPDHERVPISLRHFEGYSVDEIARILIRPVGTVTKQLSRARERLRSWLEEE